MSTSQYILVSNPTAVLDEKKWRDSENKNIVKIPTKILSSNIQGFVDDISKILDKIDAKLTTFEMKEIEVYAVVTASGELSLLGVGGGELGIEGGIKFVFAKKESQKKTSLKNKSKTKI